MLEKCFWNKFWTLGIYYDDDNEDDNKTMMTMTSLAKFSHIQLSLGIESEQLNHLKNPSNFVTEQTIFLNYYYGLELLALFSMSEFISECKVCFWAS